MRRVLAATAVLVTLVAACTADPDTSGPDSTAAPATAPAADTTPPPATIAPESLHCDPLDERACLLPWPNDGFTVPDPTTATGRRVDIRADSTPRNVDGVHIDVTDQNRADGFSPGSAILTHVPDLDLAGSGIATSTDIGSSLDPDAPIVLLDATAGERLAYWAELDAQAPEGDQVLIVHPAASLPEGHRIVVGLRDLKDTSGATIPPTTAMEAAFDGTTEPEERVGPMRDIIDTLAADGVDPDSLYVAWDFTVASSESLAGRALAMREETAELLGDTAPDFSVTEQTDVGSVRTIEGTFDAPNFLSGDGAPGSTLLLDTAGAPRPNDTEPVLAARFRCVLPLAAGAVPMIVFGHGLLGNRAEVDGLRFAAEAGLAGACATDEIGMSSDDVPNLAGILTDLSRFPEQADRMVQGLLHQQLLGRLLNAADGFVTSSAFQSAEGTPLIARSGTAFVGNSQGGILGGAASAVSSEWERVVLGVPGINYSLLLSRSSDWPPFQAVLDAAYPDPVDRVLAIQLAQMLWDRGENSGYAHHLTTDPLADDIPVKQVLLIEAFGDHQVANVSTEVLARTIGATVVRPSLEPGRSNDVEPQWGLAATDFDDPSAATLVVWDFGTPAPPPVNLPPSEPDYGVDPHGAGVLEPRVLQQAMAFLLTGTIADVCAGAPCRSDVLSG